MVRLIANRLLSEDAETPAPNLPETAPDQGLLKRVFAYITDAENGSPPRTAGSPTSKTYR